MAHDEAKLSLPTAVIGPMDLSRLLRELDNINEVMLQLKLRKSGDNVKLPKTTQLMDELIKANNVNLLEETDRLTLKHYLATIKEHAPLIHMSFSVDPSPLFLDKLIVWLRQNIHPMLLLTIGLQPNLGAGCIVRTTNRYFDLSLKQAFSDRRYLLIDRLIPDVGNSPHTAEVV